MICNPVSRGSPVAKVCSLPSRAAAVLDETKVLVDA
jgi:hypothetical protein